MDDESGEDGQTVNSLTFNLWDAAVPALPVAAQLLLAAFLAVGGCRRYLRRRVASGGFSRLSPAPSPPTCRGGGGFLRSDRRASGPAAWW